MVCSRSSEDEKVIVKVDVGVSLIAVFGEIVLLCGDPHPLHTGIPRSKQLLVHRVFILEVHFQRNGILAAAVGECLFVRDPAGIICLIRIFQHFVHRR